MIPNRIYHVFNRANDPNVLFRSDANYYYFLKLVKKYIEPIAEMYAYCLLPNHFHFVVRIRDEKELSENLLKIHEAILTQEQATKKVIQEFSNFLNAYAKAYNAMYRRRGALFLHNFKYDELDFDDAVEQAVFEVYNNPSFHFQAKERDTWKWRMKGTAFPDKIQPVHAEFVVPLLVE